MTAYYNEHNEYAAAWLRNLIDAGHIAPGDVDKRSIVDVQSTDLRGYTQIHLFAGVGGWSLALRRAGWPDDRPVLSGSCPCQPFSSAGKGHGTADERHLWPEMFRLIAECRPHHVIGEQVASPAAMAWFDGVCADLESIDYACGSIVLASAGAGAGGEQSPAIGRLVQMARLAVRLARSDGERDYFVALATWLDGLVDGGDHIRQRLYWCANAAFGMGDGELLRTGPGLIGVENGSRVGRDRPANDGAIDRLPDGPRERRREEPAESGGSDEGHPPQGRAPGFELGGVAAGGLVHSIQPRPQGHAGHGDDGDEPGWLDAGSAGPVAPTGELDFRIVHCLDGKARRISAEPGDFPLASTIPRDVGPLLTRLRGMGHDTKIARRIIRDARRNRVGRLAGYGNAIDPVVATEFVRAYMETIE